MITNTGKNILAKYLIGQAPAYASYIAIGCGARPLSTLEQFDDYSNKNELDFEMFRVPITSRGYVTENGVSSIVFTAELPSTERYEMTEIGVFSAASNPSAVSYDSRIVYSFADTETWEYHDQTSASAIPVIVEPLDGDANDNIINQTDVVFQTNADNAIFLNSSRLSRQERCRFLNNVIVMAGDMSNLELTAGHLVPDETSNHIHATGVTLDFSKNSPTDLLKLAFTVINKDGDSVEVPDNVRILFEVGSTDSSDPTGQWAKFEVNIDDVSYVAGTADQTVDFADNRYIVVTKQLQELYKSSGFTWSIVDVAKFYVTVTKDGVPSNDYYVCLDAIRFENVTTRNSLYGMTGYSVSKTTDGLPIIKNPNTANYVEFRFAMDVLTPGVS